MKAGLWQFNGETIIIDRLGNLANGQHRLNACIKSGVSFQTVLVKGVNEEAFTTIDTGRNRRASDVLAIAGMKNCTSLSAAARAFAYGLSGKDTSVITNKEIVDICFEYPSIQKWASEYASVKPNIMGAQIAGICALVELFHGEEAASQFFKNCCIGEMLTTKDPEYCLRQIVINTKSGRKLSSQYRLLITIKAANYSVQGRKTTQLKIVDGEKVVFWRGGK
jgi:hypothetical protein